ncbi:MAG: indolepyruvate ferredoxin oxidoreductase subunit alpha [Bacillota bacterium]
MKKMMLSNHAVAQGAYEAGVRVVSSYPGTPSTEITERCALFPDMHTEWAPNEKVALEVATGAAIAGARAMSCMKHVGVNVAADPLFTASYTGINGGLVIAVADDPGMHSSQNEQDSRFYAMSAHIPMLEPSDSQQAKEFTMLAFELSEKYDTPVMVRLTTRIAHSQGYVEVGERKNIALKEYKKDPAKYVMTPAGARPRHIEVEKREDKLIKDCNSFEINKIEYNNKKIGIICAGSIYEYVKEATDFSVMKLGMVHPLPMEKIKEFAENVDEVIVIEELEPFIEMQLKAEGIKCRGKELFGKQGELSVALIKAKLGLGSLKDADKNLPLRPPVMCAGCPHRSVFYILSKLKLTVTGDIGCYTLGAAPPLGALDTCICMGASVSMAHGFNMAYNKDENKKVVGVIGDSTFIHSGITGIVNSVYNKGTSTVMILDNSTTGMTGHQDNPSTGKTASGEDTYKLDLEALVRACGVKSVKIVDAYDLEAIEKAVKEETERKEVSVIIVRRPCILLPIKAKQTSYEINDSCKKCKMCLKIGCPAIEYIDGDIRINAELCTTCGLCVSLCKFGAITKEEK